MLTGQIAAQPCCNCCFCADGNFWEYCTYASVESGADPAGNRRCVHGAGRFRQIWTVPEISCVVWEETRSIPNSVFISNRRNICSVQRFIPCRILEGAEHLTD